MQLGRALVIANEVVAKLSPYCERIQIAGSIRRCKDWVNDIDILLIPSNEGQVAYQLYQMGKMEANGPKIIRVDMTPGKGMKLDVYIATPETWATLLLIRTGSKEHNIRLCSRAKILGMVLHADGRGLEKLSNGKLSNGTVPPKILCDTEADIFKALKLPYKAPEDRD